MSQTVGRVVVMGDSFRPNPDGSFGGINVQTRWLYHLIGEQVRIACGVEPELLLIDGDDGIDAAGLYDRLQFRDVLRGWARLYDGPEYIEVVADALRKHLRGAICVGFELPSYVRAALGTIGVPYIDFWVHPVRFLDDLLLACDSSDERARAAIANDSLPENIVRMTAGLRRASAATGPHAWIPPRTLLVAGQTRNDKTQIINGEFVDPSVFVHGVRRVLASYGQVLIKPHPHDPMHGLVQLVRDLEPDAQIVGDNVYHLLAQDSVAGVLTVNSSVAVEAAYFGKEVHTLAKPHLRVTYRGRNAGPSAYASIQDSFLDPDFWRGALAPFLRTTPKDGYRTPPKPNRLRTSLRNFWDFNRIDTDIAANLSQPEMCDTASPPVVEKMGRPIPMRGRMVPVPGVAIHQNGVGRINRDALHGPALIAQPLDLPAGRYSVRVEYRVRNLRTHEGALFRVTLSNPADMSLPDSVAWVSEEDRTPDSRYHTCDYEVPQFMPTTEITIWHFGAADIEVREMIVTPYVIYAPDIAAA